MTRIKKLLALTLAMVMAFTLLAMPAMAYGEDHEHECAVCSDEEIMPRQAMARCPKCHDGAYLYERDSTTEGKQIRIICVNTAECGYDSDWKSAS